MLESLIRFWKTPSFQMKCACGVPNQFKKVLSGTHKKKIEVNSWEEIREQIVKDHSAFVASGSKGKK